MIEYSVNGRAMTLSIGTSRDCGHLAELDGRAPESARADAVRREVRADAQIVADTLRGRVQIFAQHPGRQPWVVDGVEPSGMRS